MFNLVENESISGFRGLLLLNFISWVRCHVIPSWVIWLWTSKCLFAVCDSPVAEFVNTKISKPECISDYNLSKWFMSLKSFGTSLLFKVHNYCERSGGAPDHLKTKKREAAIWGACASEEISSLCRVLWVQIILKWSNSQKYDRINMSCEIFSTQVTEIGGHSRRTAGTDCDISWNFVGVFFLCAKRREMRRLTLLRMCNIQCPALIFCHRTLTMVRNCEIALLKLLA
jgi:hypothetical protein